MTSDGQRANSGSAKWQRRLRARLRRYLAIPEVRQILFVCVLMLLDPLSVVSGSSRLSEDVANRALSFSYPYPYKGGVLPGATAAPARDKILLVMLSDRDADYANPAGGYPIPLAAHGEILRTILCQQPAAIFVDMNFRWQRHPGDADALADAISYRPTANGCSPATTSADLKSPPLFVAYVPSATSDCQPMAPVSLVECDQRNAFARVRDSVTPVAMPGTDDTRRYVLMRRDLLEAVPASSSPALEVFRHVCRAAPGYAPGCADLTAINQLVGQAQDSPHIALRWGFYAPTVGPGGDGAAGENCPAEQGDLDTGMGRLWASMRQLTGELVFPRLRQGPKLGDSGWCPYHLTIGYRAVSDMAARDPERLKRMIAGRIVIYGADITAVNDVAASPVLGLLPGAHIHAMAIDNLLTFGANYWREAPEGVDRLVELSVTLALAVFASSCIAWQKQRSSRWRRAAIGIGYLIAALAAVLLIGLGLMLSFGWSPINWAGLFAVGLKHRPNLLSIKKAR